MDMRQDEFAWLMAHYCTQHCNQWVIVDGEGIICLCVDRGAQTPEGCPISLQVKKLSILEKIKKLIKKIKL